MSKEKIKVLINKIADELCWQEIDWRTEISNHDLLYDKNIFKLVDNFGEQKFEDDIINKIMEIRNNY
tara:strand:+ start:47 stop:247 length:201 start_codon:yes stop_codon:yes gene_type:complete